MQVSSSVWSKTQIFWLNLMPSKPVLELQKLIYLGLHTFTSDGFAVDAFDTSAEEGCV